jgi:cell division protein FtsL
MAMAYYDGRKTMVIDQEAELHNARINNMYTILQNAESEQLERLWEEAKHAPQASVLAPEKPVEVPAEVPTYEHTPVESDLFTPATLDRTIERSVPLYPAYQPAPTQVAVEAEKEEFTYSLTSMAKKAIAIFASAAAVMMTLICVNTHVINLRRAEIRELEQSNANARVAIARLEEEIAEARSEETIREWALQVGLIEK